MPSFWRSGRYLALFIAFWGLGATTQAQAADPALTVVEFYNPALNHYFITADPTEQAGIDKGSAGPGWTRSGLTFSAYVIGFSGTAKNVCRFYSKSQNSHFYTADSAECAYVKKDAGWQYEGLVFAIDTPDSAKNCAAGTQPVYRVYNNGFGKPVGSNHRFMADLTVAQKQANTGAFEGNVFCAPLTEAGKRADAVRFLKQASFGPTFSETDRVKSIGVDAWITEQIALPASRFTAKGYMPATRPDSCINDTTLPLRPDSYCQRDNYGLFLPQKEFWQHAISNPDQLRQRVAWALSQFFVISGTEIFMTYGMSDYQQMLRDNAFGNFATLLRNVTLHPTMGSYLDMANNQKPNPANGYTPNENYAREVLQLFSIGLNELNLDGTNKLDANKRPIPTYDQETIEGYAYVFTGWTFPPVAGDVTSPTRFNGRNWLGVMGPKENYHDLTSKELLDGVKTAAGITAVPDMNGALNSIFNHRNVPPFFSRFMIQKLVTGDPSPKYVERVATVFKDNGKGVRGDIAAVVRAILTDPEARGPEKFDSAYGQLNEPALFITQIARAINAKTDGVYFQSQSNAMGQTIFTPATVFNYYAPDHVIASNGINAPEFGIMNSSTALARVNFANAMLFATTIAPNATVYGATGTQFDWTPLTTAAAVSTDALIDKVAEVVNGTQFAPQVRAAMKPAIDAVAATDTLTRAKTALYLVAATPTLQIKR